MAENNQRLIVYGHDYCLLARVVARTLDKHRIEYEWRDVGPADSRHRDGLRALARGHLSVPTVVFDDGAVMVEPEPDEVLTELNRRAQA